MNKSVGILLASAVLAVTSACGGSDAGSSGSSEPSPSSATSAAPAASKSQELTRDNFVDRLGTAQLDAGSAHIEMTGAGAGTSGSMSGDVRIGDDATSTASRMTMDMGAMTMEMRLVDGVMYVKLGRMTGGKYLRIDLTDPDDPMVKQFGSSMDQGDPTKQLEAFEQALVSFESHGDGGEIDGVATTHLTLVVDTAKMLGDQAAARGGAQMPKQMTYDLYVGADDDLMRRMTVDLQQGSTTIDWSRWGQDVDVTAPKKSEITDAPGLGFPTGRAA